MSTQISLKLSDKMIEHAKKYITERGYDSLQEFLRELLRERLFEDERISGRFTALASQKALARNWLIEDEEKAWKYLSEEK